MSEEFFTKNNQQEILKDNLVGGNLSIGDIKQQSIDKQINLLFFTVHDSKISTSQIIDAINKAYVATVPDGWFDWREKETEINNILQQLLEIPYQNPKDSPLFRFIDLLSEDKNIPQDIRNKLEELLTNNSFKDNGDSTASLWVHGWVKQNYGGAPTVELDWTQYFNIDTQPRHIADQATWDNILRPSLVQARETLTQGRAQLTVDIRGRFSLSTAVAIGTIFPHTRGYTLQVEKQNVGPNNNLWRSDVSPSDAKFKIVKEDGKVGEHLLVALGITGDPSGELRQLYKDSPIPFSAVVYAEPESGTGQLAIGSDADAIALAIHAKEIIRQYRRKYETTDTHLVLFAPLSFCLFLGQRLRVVGDVICYECLSIKDKKYQPSVKLCTG